MAIGIAILGAGIFPREGKHKAVCKFDDTDPPSEHMPAIQACDSLSLKAIYSRSEASATALAKSADVDAYFDSPKSPSKSLDDLLQRKDIHAVIIALPILVQPAIIKKALSAGKHVLSEKPIATDVATAEGLRWMICATRRGDDILLLNVLRRRWKFYRYSIELFRPIKIQIAGCLQHSDWSRFKPNNRFTGRDFRCAGFRSD